MQVKTPRLTFNCAIDGPSGAPAIVFSHSLAANLDMWRPQVERLDGYRLVRYDTRGHGRTEVPDGPYTLQQLGDDVIALLDALAIEERVHFVGLSMGGMTAQTLALEHAHRLRSVTIANSLARVPPEAGPLWDDRMRIARESGMQALVEPTISRWFTPAMLAARGAEVDPVRAMIAGTPVAGYAGACAAIKDLDYLERLGRIALPALFIAGTHDSGASPEVMRDMQRRVPGARLIELDAAHLSNIERADEFTAALRTFIDAIEARGGTGA